jgi:hypothetical protein
MKSKLIDMLSDFLDVTLLSIIGICNNQPPCPTCQAASAEDCEVCFAMITRPESQGLAVHFSS